MERVRTAVDGYTDTPLVPGSEWHVHDPYRPQPPVVTPGVAGGAPSDAVVLFDGADAAAWVNAKTGEAAGWKVENGYMEIVRGTGSIQTRDAFGDCQLHLEFATPEEVIGQGQGRGNSGVFLLGLYEVQLLDNYDNPTYADGTCGAVYGQYPPLANACRRPGEWQTYDIVFYGPRWDADGKLARPATLTVFLNNILVQHCQAAQGPTNHRVTADYSKPHAPEGALQLQDHGNPIRFRNIWMRRLA